MAVTELTDDTRELEYLRAVAATTPAKVERAKSARQTAAALVLRYAPNAPMAVAWEAMLRCSAYLLMVQPGAERQRAEGNEQSTRWFPSGRSALRSSGAMALLSPYVRRRAK